MTFTATFILWGRLREMSPQMIDFATPVNHPNKERRVNRSTIWPLRYQQSHVEQEVNGVLLSDIRTSFLERLLRRKKGVL